MASRRKPTFRDGVSRRGDSEFVRDPEGGKPNGRIGTGILISVAVFALFTILVGLSPLVQDFLDFGAGVLALVSLSSAVLWGLASTDRKLLYPEHRLVTQSVHRILAVAGLGSLALHIWIKIARHSVSPSGAVLPFTDSSQPILIGLGTLAGYGFLGVVITGVARSAFVSPRRSRIWRGLHMSAYVAWAAALLHGLKSGRAAAEWVTQSYAACVAVVAVALLVRMRRSSSELDSKSQKRPASRPRGVPQQPPVSVPPPGPAGRGAPQPSRVSPPERSGPPGTVGSPGRVGPVDSDTVAERPADPKLPGPRLAFDRQGG